jgi:3-hydroxyisobutyrate dehydrogenase-like beta-hydroxyacid dehydrogenase
MSRPDVSVAVCGLGLMGLPIARRLLASRFRTTVWNRSPDAAQAAAAAGAEVAATPAEAAARADLVITMLATTEALNDVVFGPDGIAAAAPRALAQTGTVACQDMTALAARLPDGWDLLDAPVLGSVPQAVDGSLRLLVGADDAVFARWSPVLARLGEPTHVGPVPNGSALKQVLLAATAPMVALLAEAIALGERLGLDRTLLLDELELSRIGAVVRRKRAMVEADRYPADARLSVFAKDMRLIRQSGEDAGVPMTMVTAALGMAAEAVTAGLAERDYSVLIGHRLSLLNLDGESCGLSSSTTGASSSPTSMTIPAVSSFRTAWPPR